MAVVIYRLQEDGAIAELRIAIGGAEASPRRIVEAEYALKGRHPTSDAFTLAAEIAAKKVEPLDDQHISAGYRRELVLGLDAPRAGAGARQGVPMSDSGATKWIGMPVERLEDPPLVTGQGRFAADINFARQLHMRMVRSNHAHGRIVSIDTTEARALPGVVAVWTARDIDDIAPIDFREGPIEKLAPYRQPVLATDKVRYVGEPIAAVFAEDPYVAEDAAELIAVEIEELPPLLDARAEPGEFSPGRDTEAAFLTQGYGDVEAVFASAHTIVELDLTSAGTPACRWRRAARSAATTPRATCWSCTARPRCRTGTRS